MNKLQISNVKKMLQGIMKCQQCGMCCTQCGPIELTKDDATRISAFLGIDETKFSTRFPGKPGKRILIKSKPCEFYDNGCKIYKVRPKGCVDYPFLNGDLGSTKVTVPVKCPAALDAFERAKKLKEHAKSCITCTSYGPQVCKEGKEILEI